MPEVPEVEPWPEWNPPANPARADADGYGRIARYVVPRELERHHADVFPRGLRASLAPRRLPRVHEDVQIAQKLWRLLIRREIPYGPPPWNPGGGQIIRDPAWLLGLHGSGTCVDFAVLLAGAFLNEDLDTSLVMLCGDDMGHAGVAVRLGSFPGRAIQPPFGAMCTGTPGVSEVRNVRKFCSDDSLLLIDVATAARGSRNRSLDVAVNNMHAKLQNPDFHYIHLIDITIRQREGDLPLGARPAPPAGRQAITVSPSRRPTLRRVPPEGTGAGSRVQFRIAPPRPRPTAAQPAPARQPEPAGRPVFPGRLGGFMAGAAALIFASAIAVAALTTPAARTGAKGPRPAAAGNTPGASARRTSKPVRSGPNALGTKPGPLPGTGQPSAPDKPADSTKIPAVPTGVEVALLSRDEIEVTWPKERAATGFRIEAGCLATKCTRTSALRRRTTGPVTSTTFRVTPGRYHCFRVRAFDRAGASAWSGYGCAAGIAVPGHQQWTRTRFTLKRGELVGIKASGLINTGGPHRWGPRGDLACRPAVNYPSVRTRFPGPKLPCWSLIARVGNGRPFAVKPSSLRRIAGSGPLYLGVNDSDCSGNSGHWLADINLRG